MGYEGILVTYGLNFFTHVFLLVFGSFVFTLKIFSNYFFQKHQLETASYVVLDEKMNYVAIVKKKWFSAFPFPDRLHERSKKFW